MIKLGEKSKKITIKYKIPWAEMSGLSPWRHMGPQPHCFNIRG